MKFKLAMLVLASSPVLVLGGCGPTMNDPPPSRAERSGGARGDAAQGARREASPSGVPTRPLDSTAAMGAAADPRAAAARPVAPSAPFAKVDDAQIIARVRAELAASRDLGEARIDVDAREGVVTLSGPVRTLAVKARASEIARTVKGVVEVNDQLTLVTS